VAVVAVPWAAAAVMLPTSPAFCELVMFQPELPRPPNDDLVMVVVGVTVLVRVMWVVSVRSGLMNVVEVEVSADGVMVVVWVSVVCIVVLDVCSELDDSLGITHFIVVAVVSDAPLDGETELSQTVKPELTVKM